MAEEILPDKREMEPATEVETSVVDEAKERLEDAAELVEEKVDQAVDAASDKLDELDEKVETAVAHVAEEAELDAKKLEKMNEGIKRDLGIDTAVEETTTETAPAEAPAKRERRSKQARAAKAAADVAAPVTPKKAGLAALGVPAWLGICAAALVLGLLLGRFVLGKGTNISAVAGKTTVSESELDNAFATYTYNGKTEVVTVREAIEQNGTVDSAADADGNYKLPSAEYAISAARTAILDKEVESRGITVSDDDVKEYAESTLGTSDYESIASAYGMDAETVESLLKKNCMLNALREEIVGDKTPELPTAPETAEEGKEDEATKAYADYIIKLAGDEWDAKAGAWKDSTSPYATALADYEIKADAASYTAAQAAYYVAYQQYTEAQTNMSTKWTEYLNELLSNASIEVGSLVS